VQQIDSEAGAVIDKSPTLYMPQSIYMTWAALVGTLEIRLCSLLALLAASSMRQCASFVCRPILLLSWKLEAFIVFWASRLHKRCKLCQSVLGCLLTLLKCDQKQLMTRVNDSSLGGYSRRNNLFCRPNGRVHLVQYDHALVRNSYVPVFDDW